MIQDLIELIQGSIELVQGTLPFPTLGLTYRKWSRDQTLVGGRGGGGPGEMRLHTEPLVKEVHTLQPRWSHSFCQIARTTGTRDLPGIHS